MSQERSLEKIQSRIDYIKSNGIKGIEQSISYYNEVGANKNFTWEKEQLYLYNQEIINLETLLREGLKEILTPKVRVTEYKGNIIIETIDPETFDQDFDRPILNSIGCSLWNTKRLEMSQEAIDAIQNLKSTGYGMGDFMGDKDHFTWVGPEFCVKTPDCVKSSDYRKPKQFLLIENNVSDKVKEFIDSEKHIEKSKSKQEIEFDFWIELRQHSSWQPKENDPKTYHSVASDFHILEIRIFNHNEYENENLSKEEEEDIKKLIKNIFIGFEGKYSGNHGWSETGIKIPSKDLMSFVNGFFNLGFDNNVMNPRMDYWRMSKESTVEDFKKLIKSFKRV